MLFSCEKHITEPTEIISDEILKDFIFAGKIDSAYYIVFNDTVLMDNYDEQDFFLDINDDNINDFEFKSHHIWYYGGAMHHYWSTIKAINITEVLVDTSLKLIKKYNYTNFYGYPLDMDDTVNCSTYYINEIIPKIIDENEIINIQGTWISDSVLNFCYWDANVVTEDPFACQTVVFSGWNDLDNKFLGFRIIQDNDTLYGWLSLKTFDYNNIILYDAAYR
ncbi:MAG: hypothetical protein K8R54_07525 [Bacteroidales bacterium]|nr:hypothetical protein [Bacteroidales bacterium]